MGAIGIRQGGSTRHNQSARRGSKEKFRKSLTVPKMSHLVQFLSLYMEPKYALS